MDKTRALVWMLRAPSASGGKIYVTFVVDSYVLFGWGREDQGVPGLQFKYKGFYTPEAAQTDALTKTKEKEKRGYEMAIPPKEYTFTDISQTQVLALVRGGSPMAKQGLISDALQGGNLLV